MSTTPPTSSAEKPAPQVPPHEDASQHTQPQQQSQPLSASQPPQPHEPILQQDVPEQTQSQEQSQPLDASQPQPPAQESETARPISALRRQPAVVDCPNTACLKRDMTHISLKIGNTTHAWAALACFATGLVCIPYLISVTKDVKHECGACGTLLAVWHRSGRTEVIPYGREKKKK